ncbi:hypothetical protein C0581_00985, partial [Candidatus Parcubacteria bacterium]
MKIFLKYLFFGGLFFGLFLFGALFRSQTLFDDYASDIYRGVADVPTSDVALIFGAGVRPDGRLTDTLRDRVLTGVELYKEERVDKLVMTGDNGREEYDEVSAMKEFAIEKGVLDEDIVLDYAGFRTYDSCYRARDVFGLDEYDVVAVSQEFHLPRILYTCGNFDIKIAGLIADKNTYVYAQLWQGREFLARFKAWIDVEIFRSKPKYLGKKECVF